MRYLEHRVVPQRGTFRVGSILVALLAMSTSRLSVADEYDLSPRNGPIQRAASLTPGTKFKECRECPEMVVVPAGEVSVKFADEVNIADSGAVESIGRQVTIRIEKPFAVGIYHVTVAEFAAFVRATETEIPRGCLILDPNAMWIQHPTADWTHPFFRQTPRDPVVCINWFDAHAYVDWLNQRVRARKRTEDVSRGGYRLLSVEEYAYLAQGGVPVPKGMDRQWRNYANFGADQCSPCGGAKRGMDKWFYTSPVGSFLPNRFGIYDIAGNVYTWFDDCAHKDFVDAPTDGSAWTNGGDCRVRVGDGGAFDDNYTNSDGSSVDLKEMLKSISFGAWYAARARNYANGLRVARSLE